MQIKVKPLFLLGKDFYFGLIWQLDGSFEQITDERTLQLRSSELSRQLRDNVRSDVVLLKEAVVRSESDTTGTTVEGRSKILNSYYK